MTTIFLMRHSETLKYENINNNDSLQLQNEKWPLTVNGEKIAKEISEKAELQNFDSVYSSNYVRAVSTAKYFTNNRVKIDESFGERKFGINSWDELPSDFEKRQYEDFDYKLENGESLNDVISREEKSLLDILQKHKGQKVLIVGHSTSIAALFTKWCDVNFIGSYKYKGYEFFDGIWNYCETFKLEFDDNNELTSITNIKF